MGASGAGVFVGCGAGVGLVTPVSLHSIPLLGPLASSLSSSLGQLNSAAGGVGSAARSRVRGLGVRGLDLGAGCGAMLGYGYGAGLFLAPGALQSLTGAAHAAGQRVLAVLPPPLRQAVQDAQQRHLQQQQQQQWSALPQGAARGGVGQQRGNGGWGGWAGMLLLHWLLLHRRCRSVLPTPLFLLRHPSRPLIISDVYMQAAWRRQAHGPLAWQPPAAPMAAVRAAAGGRDLLQSRRCLTSSWRSCRGLW